MEFIIDHFAIYNLHCSFLVSPQKRTRWGKGICGLKGILFGDKPFHPSHDPAGHLGEDEEGHQNADDLDSRGG
jgi:hypothetical protein